MAAKLTSRLRIYQQAGFTLIELMVTVAIVAILAAVAVPAYTDYVTRGKIPEATSTLASMRIQMEQYYQDNRNYNADDASCGVSNPASGNFSYSCTGTNQTYKIVATGVASRGMTGFSYSIDQAGTRKTEDLPDGWGTPPASCWAVKKGGGC
jgi:type IV pilus assembly protein PilE